MTETLLTDDRNERNHSYYIAQTVAPEVSNEGSNICYPFPTAACNENIATLLSTLLSTLSHELRHPLSMSIQLSQLLQRQYYGELSPEQTAIVENILQQNRYLLNQVDTCLEIAELETGQLRLFPSYVDLEQLIPDILAEVKSRLNDHALTFILTWEMNSTVVRCDRNHLHQLLSSFLYQIAKPLQAATFRLTIVGTPYDWSLKVIFPETYPQEQLAFLQAFQISGLTLKHLSNGHALELALVNALIRKMKGRIELQNRAERDAFIQITLPGI